MRASPGHRADVQTLLTEYYAAIGVLQRDTPEQVQDWLSGTASALWIAYVDRIPEDRLLESPLPAGCIALRPLPGIASAGECKRLYVRPPFRGAGVAGHLLDALETHAREQKMEWVYLDSKDDLREALQLYRKQGYSDCERYNDNPQATVFLRRELKRSSAPQALRRQQTATAANGRE